MTANFVLREAEKADIQGVRSLFLEYQAWLGVDLCFQGFEEELATLPGLYAPPKGVIFVVASASSISGCVAIRPRSEVEAELKRLYLRPEARNRGNGRRLFEAAMSRAGRIGYRSVVLDTLPSMSAAKALYLGYGFSRISPYYNNPEPGAEFYRYKFQ